MFFNFSRRWLVSKISWSFVVLSASVLSACSLTTNDPPAPDNTIAIKSLESGCLADAGDTLALYFDGKASEDQLSGFWDCLNQSFKTFADNTKGGSETEYSGEELARFLERYFLKQKVIQPALLSKAMLLKRAILGGGTNTVTRQELNQTLELIAVFKRESRRLRPFLPIDLENPRYKDPAELNAALAELILALDNIGKALEKSVNSYTFDDFSILLQELEIFLNQGKANTESTEWIRTARDYIDIIAYAKSVLIVPPQTEISRGDWKKVFQIVPRYLALYLRAAHLWSHTDRLLATPNLLRIRDSISDLYSLLSLSLQNHENNLISFEELDRLMFAMEKKDLLPVKAEVANNFIKVLFRDILRAPGILSLTQQQGVQQSNLDRMLYEFNLWSEGQFYLEGIYAELGGPDANKAPGITRGQFLSITQERAMEWTQLRDQTSITAIQDLQRTAMEVSPLFNEKDEYAFIPDLREKILLSYNNMVQMNWLKRAVALLVDSYKTYSPPLSTPPGEMPQTPPANCAVEGIGPSLNREQVEHLFAQFFPLLRDFGLISERGADMAPKRFFESSMFLSTSNGSKCLEVNEGVELIAALLSVARRAKEVQQDIVENGGCAVIRERIDEGGTSPRTMSKLEKDDEKVEYYIEKECFRRRIFQGRREYWKQVPGFIKTLDNYQVPSKKVLPTEAEDIFDAIYSLAAERERNPHPKYITLGEVQGYMLMPYYVEMIYDRFDSDDSGTINKKEGQVALDKVFATYLREKLPEFSKGFLDGGERNVEAVYSYLLYYGEMPETLQAQAYFIGIWRYIYHKKDYEADRHRVYKVFSKILEMVYKTPKKAASPL